MSDQVLPAERDLRLHVFTTLCARSGNSVLTDELCARLGKMAVDISRTLLAPAPALPAKKRGRG